MIMAALAWHYKTVDPAVWAFMVVFTTMQFIEYFLWTNLKNPAANEFWSKIGWLNVMIQPIVLAFLIKKPELRTKIIGAYLLAMIVGNYFNPVNFKTSIGGNGHLAWDWFFSTTSIWALLWGAAFFGPMILAKKWVLLAVGSIGWVVSLFFGKKYGTIGSYWCWLAVWAWLAALAGLM